MENAHKGEVEIKAGDKTYVLRYSIDAICTLESRLDKGFAAIALEMSDPAKMRLSLVREVLFAGLQEHQPEISLKEAGELMIAAGGAMHVMKRVDEAFKRAFPDAEANKKQERPPTGPRRVGTGRPS